MLGIIGAMSVEIELIKENMKDIITHTIAGVTFYKGTINKQAIILCQSGIGKVNAAFSSTLLVHKFGVRGLLFSGVAGGVDPKLDIGDIVIGTDFLYHDANATALGYEISLLPDGELSLFTSHKDFSSTVYKIAQEAFGTEKVSQGRIISGDQFIASFDKIKEFQELYKASAVDMESAAVAHIANKSEIPCCIIRSVSDKADGQAHEIYRDFFKDSAKNAATIVLNLLNKYSIDELF